MSAIAIASGGSALTPATGNLTFYVATTGSDSNDGSSAHPFATIQHAASVAVGYDYQGIYQPTIMVADGTYHEHVALGEAFEALRQGLIYNASLIGNPTTPTNCKIAPNDGSLTLGIVSLSSSFWLVDGFSLVADDNAGGNIRGMLDAVGYSLCFPGTLDFNLGTTASYEAIITGTAWVRISGGLGTGNTHFTFQGGGNISGFGVLITASAFSRATFNNQTFVFNSVLGLGGVAFFEAFVNSTISLRNMTFTNVGNVTGGVPISNLVSSNFIIGADPTTITWPGGAFNPANVDSSSNIDGNFYENSFAGAPVDETSIYRGSWQIHKDTNQTTAGLGLNLYVDDAGTVVPLIALTPAPGNLTFFVSTTGSDSNPGTSGSPFATIQHAVSFALSFDYQSLYTLTINVAAGTYHEHISVADGIFQGIVTKKNVNPNASIIGSPLNAANTVIQPTGNTGDDIIRFGGGYWAFDGFTVKADDTETHNPAMMRALNTVILALGEIIWDWGNLSQYGAVLSCVSYTRCVTGISSGNGNLTYQGTGFVAGSPFDFFNTSLFSLTSTPNSMIFNSAYNLGGGQVFNSFNGSICNVLTTFVNPGNITGGVVVNANAFCDTVVGQDPSTVTWPSGPFSNSLLTNNSLVDGFNFFDPIAGPPVDQSSIYRGSWIVSKDTTNGPITINADDGGTVKVRQIGRFINTQTSTNYTLQLFDQDGRVEMNNAGANQLTVPANATVAFPIGTEIRVVQVGAGATTIAGAVGVTVDNAGVVGGQWKSALLYKRGTNEWVQTSV